MKITVTLLLVVEKMILASMVIVLMTTIGLSRSFYVTTTGNDVSNAGTLTSPSITIQKAEEVMSSGLKVYPNPGFQANCLLNRVKPLIKAVSSICSRPKVIR